MDRSLSFVILAVAYAPAALAADAVPPPRTAPPTSPPPYVSALAEYKPWREPVLAPWKRVNDEVARLGGHMGHVRGDAAAPLPTDAAKDLPGAKK